MKKEEIQNLIKELVEKTTVGLQGISMTEERPGNVWISVEVNEPHYFISREGEGLQALNHIVRRILEAKAAHMSGFWGVPQADTWDIRVGIKGFPKKNV